MSQLLTYVARCWTCVSLLFVATDGGRGTREVPLKRAPQHLRSNVLKEPLFKQVECIRPIRQSARATVVHRR